MTREEAINGLEKLIAIYETASVDNKMIDYSGIIDTLKFYLSALRPVSRERVEKVWRGEWANTNKEVEQICKCSKCGYPISYFWSRTQFCPNCGAPMTDEAVQMVMEKINNMEEMTNEH